MYHAVHIGLFQSWPSLLGSWVLLVRCFPYPQGGCLSWTINLWDTSPYFILINLMEFVLFKRRKFWISNIYLPNILNLQPRTMGNKRKYKEIESDGQNESPKRGAKRKKMRESKDSGRTVSLMTKKMNAKKFKTSKVNIPIVNSKKVNRKKRGSI